MGWFGNFFGGMAKSDKAVLLATADSFAKLRTGRAIHSMRVLPQDAKIMRSIGRKLVRMYEAALTTNLNADFPISLTSSNAEILTSLIGVRSRARTLERNNGYGAGLVWDWMRNIAGHDPFRLEMQIGSTDDNGKFVAEPQTNKIIMDAWKKYGRPEYCTVRRNISRDELYQQAVAAMCRDGGGLFIHRGPANWKGYNGNPINYALEPFEYDRLDQNWQRVKAQIKDANEIQFGIEMDDDRAPVAYWVLTRHPGDIFAFSNVSKYRDRIPAEDVIALFDIRTRIEQMVGMSRMSSVIRLLHQLEQFDMAHITAALTACCKTIWIEKQFPTAPDASVLWDKINQEMEGGDGQTFQGGDAGWGGGQGQRYNSLTPGEMNELEWGQKPVLLDPHFPIEAAPQFKRDILRAVASGATVWYNTLANDMESVNFASGRLGEGAARDMAMMSQEHVINMLVRPHFERWLWYWMMSRECPKNIPFSRYEEFCAAAVFNGRRWAYTNPLQDVQADILAVEAGLDSRSRIIGESPRGGNAEEVNREIQADRESDKLHNLDFSAADVTKPTISKGLPGEDKENPFDAELKGQAPDADTPGGADTAEAQNAGAGKKTKSQGINLARFEAGLEKMAAADPEFVKSGGYAEGKALAASIRKLREQKRRKT